SSRWQSPSTTATLVEYGEGSAAANVAGHRIVDVGVARLRLGGEQRARRHDLTGLAVAALRHVQRKPRRMAFLPDDVAPMASMVVILFQAAVETGVMQDRVGFPSM